MNLFKTKHQLEHRLRGTTALINLTDPAKDLTQCILLQLGPCPLLAHAIVPDQDNRKSLQLHFLEIGKRVTFAPEQCETPACTDYRS